MRDGWETGPARPDLGTDEVHVWRADLGEGRWPGAGALPAAERRRAERLQAPGAASRWTAGRWALRLVLARYLGRPPAELRLSARNDGKPEIADRDLRFNLSHSGPTALVAVAVSREVGVDVERIDLSRDVLQLARHGLDPREAESVRAAPAAQRPFEFHRLWTRREAIGKCFGTGLTSRPPDSALYVFELDVGPREAAALAVAGGREPRLRRFLLSPPA